MAATSAYADLGFTKADASSFWGQPTKVVGADYYYNFKDWTIVETYNEADRAIVVTYIKNKPLTYQEVRFLDSRNLQPGMDINCWTEVKLVNRPGVREWLSTGGDFHLAGGQMNENTWFRSFASSEGFQYLTQHNQPLPDDHAKPEGNAKTNINASEDPKTLC